MVRLRPPALVLILLVMLLALPGQAAAMAGAVIVALELSVEHWYYFYLVWIAPVALVAMLGAYRSPDAPAGEDKAPERARELAHA